MNPLGTRRGSQELARLLDGDGTAAAAVDRPSAGRRRSAELAGDQFAVVVRLRAVGPLLDAAVTPRPEFRTALRARLLAVASVQAPASLQAPAARVLETAVSWSQRQSNQRRTGVVAGATAGAIALTGVAIAGSRSLPGDPFYSLKRGAEQVQLELASGDVAEGAKHLQFAGTRLREVTALAGGRPDVAAGLGGSAGLLAAGPAALGGSLAARVRSALADMDAETRAGHRLLEDAFRRTSRTEPLRLLTSFSTAQRSGIAAVLPSLPVGARQRAETSLALVTVIGNDARSMLSRHIPSAANGNPVPPRDAPRTSPTGGVSGSGAPTSGAPSPSSPTPTSSRSPSSTSSGTTSPTGSHTLSPTASPPASHPASPTESPTPSGLPTVPEPTLTPLPLPLPLPSVSLPPAPLPTLP